MMLTAFHDSARIVTSLTLFSLFAFVYLMMKLNKKKQNARKSMKMAFFAVFSLIRFKAFQLLFHELFSNIYAKKYTNLILFLFLIINLLILAIDSMRHDCEDN